jgi:hypothetical protein
LFNQFLKGHKAFFEEQWKVQESIGKSSLTISAKPDGELGLCVSALDCEGRTIWIVDAHRDYGKRFVVHADEKLTAFDLEWAWPPPGQGFLMAVIQSTPGYWKANRRRTKGSFYGM